MGRKLKTENWKLEAEAGCGWREAGARESGSSSRAASIQGSAHSPEERPEVAVGGLGPPGHPTHKDHDLLVEHGVENAVSSHADAVEDIFEVNAAFGTRVFAKRAYGFDHALSFGTG